MVQDELVQRYNFTGFPVVQEEMFLGFVGREKLRLALGLSHSICPSLLMLIMPIEQLLGERSPTELAQECTFSTSAAPESGFIDLSSIMEVSVLELRTEVPLELVVNMIQKMVSIPISPLFLKCQQDVQLPTELATDPFHTTGEADGINNQV